MISIIIPFFNVERYFGECIDSVLSQEYGELDVILVNDGSTDSSLEIARQHASRDSRVFIINKVHGGVSSARNMGIEFIKGSKLRDYVDGSTSVMDTRVNLSSDSGLCGRGDTRGAIPMTRARAAQEYTRVDGSPRGIPNQPSKIISNNEISIEHSSVSGLSDKMDLSDNIKGISRYINFTDSDDKLHSSAFYESYKVCVELDLDVLTFVTRPFFDGVQPIQPSKKVNYREYEGTVLDGRECLKRFLYKDFAFVCSGIFHLRAMKDLRFIENILFEDHHFGIKLFYQSDRISFMDKVMYFYRIRPNSISICDYSKTLSESSFFSPLFKYFKSPLQAKEYCTYFSRIVSAHSFYFDKEFREPFKSGFCFPYLANGVYIKRLGSDPFNAQKYIDELMPFIRKMGFRTNFAMKCPHLFMFLLWLRHHDRMPRFIRGKKKQPTIVE